MRYRNGREAKIGDTVVCLNGGEVTSFSELYGATLNTDDRGRQFLGLHADCGPHAHDCLHIDDLRAILAEKGLDKESD